MTSVYIPVTVLVKSWVDAAATCELQPADIANLMAVSKEWNYEMRAHRADFLRAHLVATGTDRWMSSAQENGELIVMSSNLRVPAVVRTMQAMQDIVYRHEPGTPYKKRIACVLDGSLVHTLGDGDSVYHTIIALSMLYAYVTDLHQHKHESSTIDIRPWMAFAMFKYVGQAFASDTPACKDPLIATLLLKLIDNVGLTVWSGNDRRLHERLHWMLYRVQKKLRRAVQAQL